MVAAQASNLRSSPVSKTSPFLNACPCDSGQSFAACCTPALSGIWPDTALALMRSRYCGYVLQRANYLLASWHPDTRPPTLTFEAGLKWLGLSILASEQHEQLAFVSFRARFRFGGGKAERLQERSRFVRLGQRWLYLDGEIS